MYVNAGMYDFFREILNNPVFNGVIGGSLVVSVLYVFRQIPASIANFLWWRFTSELTVFNEDAAFERVSEWLTSLDYAKKARHLRLTSNQDNGEDTVSYSPGLGKHLVWLRGRPILIERTIPKDMSSSWKRREDIRIVTLGTTTPKVMHALVEDILQARKLLKARYVDVYLFQSYWRLACRKPKRSLESVILPQEQQERIVNDIHRFMGRAEWYGKRGIPYRRGLLLKGPPGCGKTSLVLALASHFAKPVYTLNLGSIRNDNELIDAIIGVPDHAILLIEDIDAAKAAAPRATEPVIPSNPNTKSEDPLPPLSLSVLLNAIDGIFAKEGRILIMTTNHPDNIDPALLRPGRADLRENIGPLCASEVEIMCRRFVDDPEKAASIAASVLSASEGVPLTPAELQEILLKEDM